MCLICDRIEMIKNGTFHNYGKEYFESVFGKIEDYRGAVV